MDKIEDRKRKVDQFFRAQLEKEGEQNTQPFGGIDLHVWATAVHRPALANAPAKPQEPYQVAELFRQTIASAVAFHGQRRQAQRKLHATFGAALGVAALLILLALAFFLTREAPATALLENQIKNFLGTYNKDSPDRLKMAADVIPVLEKFQKEPAFSAINPELRAWVNSELTEMRAYHKYDEELKKETTDPATISSYDKLKELEAKLNVLDPPKDYAAAWQETPAVKLRNERLKDVKAMNVALKDVKDRLDEVLIQAKILKKDIDEYMDLPKNMKPKAAEKILEKQEKLRSLAAGLKDRKKTDKDLTIPGSERVTWTSIFRFPDVEQRYADWEGLEPKVLKSII
jgi:hypothetical protein